MAFCFPPFYSLAQFFHPSSSLHFFCFLSFLFRLSFWAPPSQFCLSTYLFLLPLLPSRPLPLHPWLHPPHRRHLHQSSSIFAHFVFILLNFCMQSKLLSARFRRIGLPAAFLLSVTHCFSDSWWCLSVFMHIFLFSPVFWLLLSCRLLRIVPLSDPDSSQWCHCSACCFLFSVATCVSDSIYPSLLSLSPSVMQLLGCVPHHCPLLQSSLPHQHHYHLAFLLPLFVILSNPSPFFVTGFILQQTFFLLLCAVSRSLLYLHPQPHYHLGHQKCRLPMCPSLPYRRFTLTDSWSFLRFALRCAHKSEEKSAFMTLTVETSHLICCLSLWLN